MSTNSIITRIKNLMDLAGNNPSEEEAASAMSLARKLMLKHNLDESDLAESSGNLADFGDLQSYDQEYIRILFNGVGKMTSTSFVNYGVGDYKIVGRKINQEVAQQLLVWLISQVEQLYKIHLPRGMSKAERAKYRKDFKRLCSYRIYERAKELVEAEAPSSDSTALIIVENQLVAEIEELFKEAGVGIKKSRIRLNSNSRGGRDGYSAGNAAALRQGVN